LCSVFPFVLPSSSVLFSYNRICPLLLPFPTRRSPDLSACAWATRPSARPTAGGWCARAGSCTARHRRSGTAARACSPDWPTATRSEEHTSELQSRENLVCRLLLEKKNTCCIHL